MKKNLYIMIALAVILTVSVNASQVKNVDVRYNDGFTTAVISVDGPVRFTHQTEEAKDGKPFRVIVDILSATHELGSKNFYELPNCPIQSIRTSQFAVTPEKIVRFVFDMDAERVYRIDSDKNSVSLIFFDKSTPKFASWSSTEYIANKKKNAEPVKIVSVQKTTKQVATIAPIKTKSAADLNKSINNDRLLSLHGSVDKSKSISKKTVSKPHPKVTQKVQFYGPDVDIDTLAKDVKADNKAKQLAKIEADKKAKELAKIEADKKAKQLAKIEADKKAKELAKIEADKKAKKLAKIEADKKAKQLVKIEADKKAKELAKIEADKKAKQLAKIEADKKKKSTSRFRRNPVSNKVKGTMVAQFPKRLVIKYKSKSYRDPFATLIDESKTYNNPVEKKIPNVEGLKLVGIIQADQKSENRALFEDNDGYGYILKTGDKVRKGYVLRVNSDKVYFQIFEYGWSRTVALNLES